MKTRDQFIAAFHHEFAGMMLDAATSKRSGAELSILLKGMMDRVDLRLGQAWDWLQEPKAANAVPQPNGANKP